MKKNIVLKIGGSTLYDKDLNINIDILSKVKKWYIDANEVYDRIVLVVGGGRLSRYIQEKLGDHINDEKYRHQIGMSVTQISANILSGYLDDREIYIPRKLGDAYEYLNDEERVRMVSGGLKSGWSTDMDAMVYADILHMDRVFKISNVEYIYTTDPKEDPLAKPILDISWDEYFKMFGITESTVHVANSNIPIDSSCANFARKKGISMHITGGKRINTKQELEDLLQNGTYIHP